MANKCETCRGKGRVTCGTCAGVASYAGVPLGVDAMLQPCPKCGGKGRVACDACKGTGEAR